jgi:hypothetical protein
MTSNVETTAAQRTRGEMLVQRSAGWFLFVALISLINSILYFLDFHVEFLVRLWGGLGLAVTEVVPVLARRSGGVIPILALIFSVVISALFIVLWKFARKGNLGAFYAGAGLYALDAIWILISRIYVNVAFHAIALFFMLGGVYGISRLQQLKQAE